MKSSAFCTTAPIGMGHGGGASSYWELEALKVTTEVKQVIDMKSLDDEYADNVFMQDYATALTVDGSVDVVMTNGGTWSATVRALNPSRLIADSPAHKLALSIEEWERMGRKYPYRHMSDPKLWVLYSQYLREADVVITQAKQSVDYLKELGICPKSFEVVPGGCILPNQIKPFSNIFKVGYIGAIGSDKGLAYLVKAWIGLMYKNAVCVLAGEYTPKLKPQLEPFTRVKFEVIGKVEDISVVYNDIHVYVQPSVTEGFGLPVLEAMAYGRPVIVTEGAGVHELIDDGVEGYVVPIRDPVAIADRIRWFYDNPMRLEEMGKAARNKAEQYPWQRAFNEYKRIIDK